MRLHNRPESAIGGHTVARHFDRDIEQFVEALAELDQRGGDEFLEALFREQIEVRQYWIRTLN